MPMKLVSLLALGGLMLSGCIRPEQFESAPIEVETSRGLVTCQLYTRGLLDWDRSIDRPASMSVDAADQICRAEGRQRVGGA